MNLSASALDTLVPKTKELEELLVSNMSGTNDNVRERLIILIKQIISKENLPLSKLRLYNLGINSSQALELMESLSQSEIKSLTTLNVCENLSWW